MNNNLENRITRKMKKVRWDRIKKKLRGGGERQRDIETDKERWRETLGNRMK